MICPSSKTCRSAWASWLIGPARALPLPATERTEANRVKGCVSLAWIVGELREGRCHFRSDADSPLVRGLLTLLCDFYTDASPAEVASVEPRLFEELGLTHNLSPTPPERPAQRAGKNQRLRRPGSDAKARVVSGPVETGPDRCRPVTPGPSPLIADPVRPAGLGVGLHAFPPRPGPGPWVLRAKARRW